MRDHVRRIHFIGIGGSGMSGIAEVLLNEGYDVSGSDRAGGPVIERLRACGAVIQIGHDPGLILDSDVVVVSTAIDEDNPEVLAARCGKIPVIPRAEMLGELMRFRKGIAIAGTHGKTTTTSLVACVLAAGGLDPTFVVGGLVNSAGTNAVLGQGAYLVAEADESDASFLNLQPEIAAVTNIDADHMETYSGDFERLRQTFIAFLRNLPFYGLAVLCIDDPVIQTAIAEIRKPVLTYGKHANADIRAVEIRQSGIRTEFDVVRKDNPAPLHVDLALPGEHNVLNALAAIAIGGHLGVADAAMADALGSFAGIGRRFQLRGEVPCADGKTLLVDDYGHHPREIAATLEAARTAWPRRRIVMVFQPHRYTRTRDLMDDFSQVLAGQDPLLVTEVYAAGESPLAGADGRALCRAIRARGRTDPIFVESLDDLPDALWTIVRDGDVLLVLGAGDIGRIARELGERGIVRTASRRAGGLGLVE